uniref:F-box domain-containing protein n=1 Tax=Ditylenchus dipsaci TaxID=166011 RepID=A0A915EUU5_9BILA
MNQTNINELPIEILAHIFEHLNYRQRVQIEGVCSYWKLAGKQQAWKKVKRLKFTRKMLCLKEPWNNLETHWKIEKLVEELNKKTLKDDKMPPFILASSSDETWNIYKQALSNSEIYKQPRAARTLGAFSAIIQRCGPYLTELHLQGIGVNTRFGRYFHFMPLLKHLRIDEPLDKWHLEQIGKYYSSQLISLAVKVKIEKLQHLFMQILCNSTKLECLRVQEVAQLLKHDEQGYLQAIISPNLKYLQIDHGFISYFNIVYIEAIGDNILQKILRLQLPYSNQLDRHPSFHSIKALDIFNREVINEHFTFDQFCDEFRSADFLNILSCLNETNPLRNIEFAENMSFSVQNVMQFARLFTHLESFYCIMDDLQATECNLFCKELADVLLQIDSDIIVNRKEDQKEYLGFK